MDLLDLFKANKQLERGPLNLKPRRDSYAPSEISTTSSVSCIKPVEQGTEYVKQYVEEENEKALAAAKLFTNQKSTNKMDEMSIGTFPSLAAEIESKEVSKIYETFDFEHRPKDNLPIVQSRDEIVSHIQTHSITIVEGVTGCGKSTQVPQYILDSCYKQKKHCNIIVTQPRRIAALSIADRVARERKWPLGTLVGVQVGMYRNVSKDTRLTYCTTGVLLRKLITAKNMLEFTHIVLDEVHERDQEMDFLLLVIRKLLRTNSRQVKVVLMSATFNVKKFSEYFSIPTETGFVPSPIVTIPKKRNFKVHTHYLCQLDILGTLPEVSYAEPKVTEKMMQFCMKLVKIFDEIDRDSEYDADDLVEFDGEKPRHATLIFLPGIWEIEEMHTKMVAESEEEKWDIVILHSSITHEEQSKIFTNPPRGHRRIILSTNIAESSITIDDIKYVIDFCLTKQLVTDPGTNFQCLELTWASKANCEQRAGRAGRLMDGRAYRLVPKAFYEKLPAEGEPEIVRAPLESVVLQTKLLDMGEPKAVLALAIDPPDLRNLERTILLLKEAGGLIDLPGAVKKFDGELTDLGRIMAALPIEIHLAKLIALGHVFNVLRETIIMAASMALKSMFSNPFLQRMEAYCAKIHWADGSTSDSLAFLNVYRVWQSEITGSKLKRKSAAEKGWAKRNFIQVKVIHEVDYLVSELTKRLEALGIKETFGPKKMVMNEADRGLILKIVLAGAFYPNYFVRNNSSEENDETHGTRELGGLDPTRTVYLQGWKNDHPGRLYAKCIQDKFKGIVPNHHQALVEFDGSFRVYVMFSDDKLYGTQKKEADIPGKISLSVYKALKLRKMGHDMSISITDLKSAKQLAESLKISSNNCSMFFNTENFEKIRKFLPTTLPNLPGLDVSTIPLKIVHFESPGKFWAHVADSDTVSKMHKIEEFLNDQKNITLTPVEETPAIGALLAAEWKDKKLYRVIVESYYKVQKGEAANVYYIDFGYRRSVPMADLKVIKADHEIYSMRALAFECRLSQIAASKRRDAKGLWTREASDLFNKYTGSKSYQVFGTVYSVVDSIVSLRLTCISDNQPENSLNLNDLLLKEGLADPAEEGYLSKYNNRLREEMVEYQAVHRDYLEYLQYNKNFLISSYPDPPPDCRLTMLLKGPNSPLEITLTSLAIIAGTKKVSIENQSVNSILLDTDPDNPYDRLLVSGIVSQNQSGTTLNLRNTTLMPNIPGLTALMCLIFAPKIELRRSPRGTTFVGALCGLGGGHRNTPLLPEHDMEVYFDTEISLEDLQNINRLRHWMNMGICVQNDEVDDLHDQAITCQLKVNQFLKKLIDRQIKPMKPEKILNFNKWGYYDDSLFLNPGKTVMKVDSIYPLHNALQLEELDEEVEEMMLHVRDLRAEAVSDPRRIENVELYCKLCDQDIYGREALRVHLFNKEHREHETRLGIKI